MQHNFIEHSNKCEKFLITFFAKTGMIKNEPNKWLAGIGKPDNQMSGRNHSAVQADIVIDILTSKAT